MHKLRTIIQRQLDGRTFVQRSGDIYIYLNMYMYIYAVNLGEDSNFRVELVNTEKEQC